MWFSINCKTMNIRKIKGICGGMLLALSAFLGSVFMQGPFFIVFLFTPRLFLQINDTFIGLWEHFCVALLEKMMGIRVVITGDRVRPGDRCLIMMNHKTRLDWMYFWSVLVRQSNVKAEKIILKSQLKHIPGAGWAMQLASFIFIKRNWTEDQEILAKMIDYFATVRTKPQILIFPEGTDLTDRTKKRSDEFAEKNNLPCYQYVLHPRTMGFNYTVQRMRQSKLLEAVYDVTVAYPYNYPQTEPELISGNAPKEVHFHIRRHPAKEIPDQPDLLQAWCKDRWAEKEKQLERYYTTDRKFDTEQSDCTGNINVRLYIAIIYWTTFMVGIIVLLYLSSMVRWYMLFQILFFLVMGYCGGFEIFKADYTAWLCGPFKPKPKHK